MGIVLSRLILLHSPMLYAEGRSWGPELVSCTNTIVILKWPLRLLVASEVTSDLIIELSGLKNLGCMLIWPWKVR